MTKLVTLALTATIAVVAAGCGSDATELLSSGAGGAEPAGRSGSDEAQLPTEECHNPELGYRVAYPADWHTNDGDILEPCRVFDPEPLQLEEGTEIPLDTAISTWSTRHSVDELRQRFAGEARDDVRSVEEIEVDGRPALRMTATGTGEALLPDGTDRYAYFVELGRRTLVLTTHDLGDPAFDTKRAALDRLIESFEAR